MILKLEVRVINNNVLTSNLQLSPPNPFLVVELLAPFHRDFSFPGADLFVSALRPLEKKAKHRVIFYSFQIMNSYFSLKDESIKW